MLFSSLPTELLIDILKLAIAVHPKPLYVLVLNKQCLFLCLPMLYSHPHIRSARALTHFPTHPPSPPRDITISLASGRGGEFRALSNFFRRYMTGSGNSDGSLNLDNLSLRMNSTSNPERDDITLEALQLVK
jgi:hypothetical protein